MARTLMQDVLPDDPCEAWKTVMPILEKVGAAALPTMSCRRPGQAPGGTLRLASATSLVVSNETVDREASPGHGDRMQRMSFYLARLVLALR
jgi:hypothetical protein